MFAISVLTLVGLPTHEIEQERALHSVNGSSTEMDSSSGREARLASSFGAPAQRFPGAIQLLRDGVEPLAALLLTPLLRFLQELVLLAD
jgi:hypothetical protein